MKELIEVARGVRPASLLLVNGRIVNLFTGEIEEGNLAIFGERIAGVGDYEDGERIIDLQGEYICPALIDAHIHLESTYLHPFEYAKAVVPRGVLGVVSDLHEIANVCGIKGIKYYLEAFRNMPMDLYLMAPSCVPSSKLETAGAKLDARKLSSLKTFGLGEVMNFPGVIGCDEDVLRKIRTFSGKVIDGHSPLLSGKELNAYISAGIMSDHETTRVEEGREKLKKGMWLMIREGSSEKNLEELFPLINEFERIMLVVDDRTCVDLLRDGDVDGVLRKAIKLGLDPIKAIKLCTLNPAMYLGLRDMGAIAPGYIANIITLKDLEEFKVSRVIYRGELVAKNGNMIKRLDFKKKRLKVMKVKKFKKEDLILRSEKEIFPVIEIIPGQIITRRLDVKVRREGDKIIPDPKEDVIKLVVVERHKGSGNIGIGLVKGFGLRRGALASSVAHDAHNIIACGIWDEDIYGAIKEVERLGGGLVAYDGKVLASLPLPIAGLLSNEPLENVVARLEELERTARDMGCELPSPFHTLSFLALPVIPELKLTDKGLVDVMKGRIL